VIIGTAGHIDHGKTALVKALTGIDTDRLREEKERGISIDLGFAHFDLPGGIKVGVVDVPGHERFIKNMLAGVGGIDFVLFVVACDESIMPQTREHFEIVSLLGVSHAVFALTKSDMVDREMVEAVREEVAELIEPTPFKGSPVIATSVTTGEGLEQLRRELEAMVARIEERRIGEAVRLPIDRVFSMTGRGTVVTGRVERGVVKVGEEVEIVGIKPTVKTICTGVEMFRKLLDQGQAGDNVGVLLRGTKREDVERGQVLAKPGSITPHTKFTAEIYVLSKEEGGRHTPFFNGYRPQFYFRTTDVTGSIELPAGTEMIMPGDNVSITASLIAPIAMEEGLRFAIREGGRTVGAGAISAILE
jgi:elongation factor Tu